MKKTCISILLCIAVMFFSLNAYADESIEIKMIVDNPKVTVNGKEMVLDVPPTIVNARTLVPIRFISEALGALVEWDGPTRTITIRVPNAKVIREKLEEIRQEAAELKEKIDNYKTQMEDMKRDLNILSEKNIELSETLENIQQEHEAEIQLLTSKISALEEMVENLKEKLAEGGGTGYEEEANGPNIELSNIAEGQRISEAIDLQGNIMDESPIAFVRIKIGTMTIHEGQEIAGTINPARLISGEYTLTVEAIDAFGNKTELNKQITIANAAKDEPIKLLTKIMDLSAMGGGSMLFTTTTNKASSYVEVLKMEVFNDKGERFEVMPGIGLLDAMMMQFEMQHMLLQRDDKVSLPVAMDMEESGKPAKEFFKGWKVRASFFDPIMEREFVLETTYQG